MIQKCLHGKTQNANECFNGMIWERLPKKQYVGLGKLKLGVSDAIANFNYGKKASIDNDKDEPCTWQIYESNVRY